MKKKCYALIITNHSTGIRDNEPEKDSKPHRALFHSELLSVKINEPNQARL